MADYPTPPFSQKKVPMPGRTSDMTPRPDHGEESYKGSGKLEGLKAIITGGDSGIGRAVAIAYAREGADVLISYLDEDEDAKETARWVEKAGRKAVLVRGDIQSAEHCRQMVDTAALELGGIDILVNNAAHQATFDDITKIPDEEWELTFRVNIHAMFYLTKAAVPHMTNGGSIINTASINSDSQPQSVIACLRHDQGCDPEFHGRSCANAGRQEDPCQHGCTRANLDTPHPINHAGGVGEELRQAGADGTPRAARGTADSLCDAGRPAFELRLRCDDRRHWGQADPLRVVDPDDCRLPFTEGVAWFRP